MAKPQTASYQTEGIEFPLFPDVIVQLSGVDGNVFAILGAVRLAMRRGNLPEEAIRAFLEEAKASDYDHALQTVMRTINVK